MSELGKISFLPNPPLAYITKSWLRFNSRNLFFISFSTIFEYFFRYLFVFEGFEYIS